MFSRALAIKWRPTSFDLLVGQEHITKTLINALTTQHLHHAYLFCGTRGVGKTTVARILAKSLSCEQGILARSCDECSTCRAIDAGNYVDLIEVDAASRTKVEDTRELLGDMQFAPVKGRYKIYLIDEVHMLSNHSFNALLKTLEEPPPHILFLFATTEPQKLPITVVSRCLKFNLKAISQQDIISKLKEILAEEKVEFDEGSLSLLSYHAFGSMRDALSLTDQAIAYCNNKLVEAEIAKMLGVAGLASGEELLSCIAAGDLAKIRQMLQDLEGEGGDFVELWHRVMQCIHELSLVLLQGANNPAEAELLQLANKFSREELQLFYQIALLTKKELPWLPSPRRASEMGFIRMLSMQPLALALSGEEIPSRYVEGAGKAAKAAAAESTEPAVVGAPLTDKSKEAAVDIPVADKNKEAAVDIPVADKSKEAAVDMPVADKSKEAAVDMPVADKSKEAVVDMPVADKSKAAAVESPKADKSKAAAGNGAEPPVATSRTPDYRQAQNWSDLVDELNMSGIAESLLNDTRLVEIYGGIWILQAPAKVRELLTEEIQQRIAQALSEKLHHTIELQIEIGNPAETPAMLITKRRQSLVDHIKQEPIVNLMINKYGGKIDESSVRELKLN